MEERCDQITHCRDESDEDNCELIVFKDYYNNKVPPFTVNPDKSLVPVKVKVSTSLMDVLAISEFSHTIDLKLGITLKWYENRVLFYNLKAEEALNVLTDFEVLLSFVVVSSVYNMYNVHFVHPYIWILCMAIFVYKINIANKYCKRLVNSGFPTSSSGTQTVTRR